MDKLIHSPTFIPIYNTLAFHGFVLDLTAYANGLEEVDVLCAQKCR